MGKEAAAERYEPGPEFEEVKEEAMLDISPTESKEFWLIQWIKDKDLDASGFHGKELSLKLHKDGNLGSLESSSGKSYDLVSFAYQQPDATVFLPSGSETKAVGKISRRVCLVRHREREELKKPNFGSLVPSSKKSAVSSVRNSASRGKQEKEEIEKAIQVYVDTHPKSKLHDYASKRGIQGPLYCDMQQGPPFKSKVVINGLTFVSPEEYPSRKVAEKAAAKLALESLLDSSSVPPIPYKNILQQLADKEHYLHPRYSTTVMQDPAAFISTVEFRGEIFKGEPGRTRLQAQINAAKVACQHFEKKREGSDSSHPVLGGSDMQNAMSMPSSGQETQSGGPSPSVPKTNDSDPVLGGSDMQNSMSMPSSGQEIQSGEPGPSVPKTNDSDAGSSKEALAKKYCSSQGEQISEHKRKREDESNGGDPNVSGKTSEGPDAPGAESNTAAGLPLDTPEEPPKKVKIADQ